MVELLIQESQKIGINLTNSQANTFLQYAKNLKHWNKKINLTRITDDQSIVIKHFLDSMSVSTLLSSSSNYSVLDVGTGAGFPGIPLGLILPNSNFTLLDSSRKRVNFLKYIITVLNLNNTKIHHGRIEDLKIEKEKYDIVVSRAFTEIGNYIHLTKSLIKKNGIIIAMKGKKVHEEINKIKFPDDMKYKVTEYNLPIIKQKRYLVCFEYI